MGRDHVNSNDFGKGADIFNDIPKMINELLPIIEEGIEKLKGVTLEKANMPPNPVKTIEDKIKILGKHTEEFNNYRENRRFRTCGGGKGDPENDQKYSRFKKSLIEDIEKLFWVDIEAFKGPVIRTQGSKRANWISITKFQKLKGRNNEKKPILPDAVKLNIVDEQAVSAKISELGDSKGAKKDINDFNKWYNESMDQLIEIFRTLADIAEVFYLYKMQIWRETRLRTREYNVYHNGYATKADEGLSNPGIAERDRRKKIAEQNNGFAKKNM